MSLIDKSYFTKELHIGDLSNTLDGTPAMLDAYIVRYEKEYLIKLLGKELYNEFMAGLEEDPVLQKWIDLQNEIVDADLKISPIANYVYFNWQERNYTKNVGIGQVKNKAENATVVRPYDAQVKAWNEMVDMGRDTVRFVNDNGTEYPGYNVNYSGWWFFESSCRCHDEGIFSYKNTLNL